MQLSHLLIATIIFCWPLYSKAKLDRVPFSVLSSNSDMSVLEMSCQGDKPFATLTCTFIQKSVRLNEDALVESKKAIDKMKESDFKKTLKELPSVCDSKEFKNGLSKANVLQARDYGLAYIEVIQRACDCASTKKSSDCVKNYLGEIAQLESKTCKFTVNQFSVELKKIGEDKWMNTPEPRGLCNNVNAITLEFDGEYRWTFTQTRLSSDSGPLCQFEVNKPVIYKTGDGKFKLNCEFVDVSSVL